MAVPYSLEDQDPKRYAEGVVHEVTPGQPGGIHDHETVVGKRYRHSHARWDTPHTHPRDDVHPFEPSEFTTERRGVRTACAVCGHNEHATIHPRS